MSLCRPLPRRRVLLVRPCLRRRAAFSRTVGGKVMFLSLGIDNRLRRSAGEAAVQLRFISSTGVAMGGLGGGGLAWLLFFSLSFPMWRCVCLFDHVNPCLAPPPPPTPPPRSHPSPPATVSAATHTPQRLTEIDSPLHPTQAPPPPHNKLGPPSPQSRSD